MLTTTTLLERERHMDEFNQNPDNREPKPAPVTESTQRHKPTAAKRRGGFIPGFFGVVIGALLVWFIMQWRK